MVLAFLLAGLFGRSLQRQPLRERLRRDGFRPPRDGFRREPRNGRRRFTGFDGGDFVRIGNGTDVTILTPPPPPRPPPFVGNDTLPTTGETLDVSLPPSDPTPPPPSLPPPKNGGPLII